MEQSQNPVIIGAGPAGLTAALKLVERGVKPRIFESSGEVGGLARTGGRGEWRVDPGGHRFFTKSEEILDLWRSLLPADQWVAVQRSSAMLVHGRFVQYPLVARDLIAQLGPRHALQGLGSFLWAKMGGAGGHDDSDSFRAWGEQEFGPYWYKMFFDGYVRKTWLADPEHITSDWANQRIKPINWRLRKEPELELSPVASALPSSSLISVLSFGTTPSAPSSPSSSARSATWVSPERSLALSPVWSPASETVESSVPPSSVSAVRSPSTASLVGWSAVLVSPTWASSCLTSRETRSIVASAGGRLKSKVGTSWVTVESDVPRMSLPPT